MARKSSRKSAARPASSAPKAKRDLSEREKIVEAFLNLLAEKPIEQISFTEIADQMRQRRFAAVDHHGAD